MLRRAALLALSLCVSQATAAVTGTASLFSITDATQGSCGLRGFDTSTQNFIYMASVSAKDVATNDGCGRCVKVSKDGGASVTAYVMDVCAGCASGQVRLSPKALSALGIDLTTNNAPVSYKFTPCPSTMLSGNVRACLMDGAGKWYLPLQFYNSQKIITKANIDGVDATTKADAFYFSATPKDGNALGETWYQNVQVKLTAKDGEERSGTFAFSGAKGCAESTFQFSQASTAEADDTSNGGAGSKKSNVLLFGIIGAVAGLIVVVGSVFLLRRRRLQRPTEAPNDLENGYLSPSNKADALFPTEPTFPTAKFDGSQTNQTVAVSDVQSPTADFKDAHTPMAPPLHASSSSASGSSASSKSTASARDEVTGNGPAPVYAQAPKVTAQPKFTFSKPAGAVERPTSPRPSYRHEGPTLPAPVLPPAMAGRLGASDDESDGRGSFDIDDLRTTEAKRPQPKPKQPSFDDAPYPSEPSYVNTAVTSPQSYVRATTLVRPSTRLNRDSARDSARYAPAPSSSPQAYDDHRDSYTSDSFAASNGPGGYRRDSLGILGYPYARKPSSRGSNITEMQF